ncbi:MAG TPA: chromate transporter [Verrucomicrobiae bacterium]|nr:chromate transporter [Verrucomicrobiae bacterium]
MGELLHLFINMVTISLITFGGGGPAFFYQVGVVQTHWITAIDLSAVLAFGYATPGPAANGAAAFMGYRVGGIAGFGVGALGIYIAPWILSLLAAKYLSSVADHPHVQYFVKGVSLAAPGVVAVTAIHLLPPDFSSSLWLVCIGAGSFLAIAKWKANPLLVMAVGGILGIWV